MCPQWWDTTDIQIMYEPLFGWPAQAGKKDLPGKSEAIDGLSSLAQIFCNKLNISPPVSEELCLRMYSSCVWNWNKLYSS